MKSILNKSAFWFLLGTLWVASATAWAQPRISVHPLMVEQTRLGERWNALFMREVARHKVAMTPEPLVEEFLEQHAGSCKNDTECLRNLGYATKAHYVIFGGMYRTENAHMVYVNIMLVDGTSVKKVGPMRVERISKTSEEANIMAAYNPLFAELKLESLNPHPEVPLDPPVVIIPPPVEIPVEVPVPVVLTPTGFKQHDKVVAELSQSMSPMRKTSYALFGVAGATAATGTVFALLANKNHKDYRRKYSLEGGNMSQVPAGADPIDARKLKDKVFLHKTIALTTFSAAGACAIAGTVLFFLSPERYVKKNLKLSLVPVEGGALLGFHGVFP